MISIASSRRALVPLLAVAVPLLAAYWFVIASLAVQWADDPNYAHGFFVLPMALVLAWRRREVWWVTTSRPDARGLVVIAAAGALYLSGLLAAELFTMRVSLVVAVAGILFTLEGARRLRVMRFPVLFLLAMVPLPYVFYYRLTFPLQLESSRLAAALLDGMGMPLVPVLRVTNLDKFKTILVNVNDRGPFVRGRILDLSYGAARELDAVPQGSVHVKIEAVETPEQAAVYTVQAAAFAELENAKPLRERLQRKYETVSIVPFDTNVGKFYRARVGSYPAEEKAERIAGKLTLDGLEPVVVRKD